MGSRMGSSAFDSPSITSMRSMSALVIESSRSRETLAVSFCSTVPGMAKFKVGIGMVGDRAGM
jgi:hypothetical protein